MRSLILPAILVSLTSLAADRPNILWLTAEDHGPHLGCYGDKYATTPNLDALARKGMLFKRAWSCAPVCAPARTCIISGRWAPADGAEHMRSEVPLPQGHQMYPQLMRKGGYYCTNAQKEDYNIKKPDGVWDDSSRNGHWKHRKKGQPFFAIFNHEQTHESRIREKPHTLVHDLTQAPVPPYQPDTIEVRHDWAQYYDNITTVDGQIAKRLKEIEDAGLAEDTIVFYYADHGAGMPRSKRWPYNSGLHMPLIVYFPEKWKHLAPKGYAAGGASDELVSFIDLAPTLLSIAGIEAPGYMQGRAFAGKFAKPALGFVHGFRGRMDERHDLVRSVTDGRYVYVRHYMPHLPYGQHLNYMFLQATTRTWHDLFDAGKTNEMQSRFWKEKPTEELYDLHADPWEIENLAGSTAHAPILDRLRTAHTDWMIKSRDLGFIPEAERLALSQDRSPKDAFATDGAYPITEVLVAAGLASDRSRPDPAALAPLLDHSNAVIRYWGVVGLIIRGEPAIRANAPKIEQLLGDSSASVRIAAAEALASSAENATVIERCAKVLLTSANVDERPYFEAIEALNALDRLTPKLPQWKKHVDALPDIAPKEVPGRLKEYCARLMQHISEQK